jgi:DNA adenine methylase
MSVQKPFLKWIGGKTQIINDIITLFPKEMNNYHEVFLGGGSVLFALLSNQRKNKIVINEGIYAYDLNEDLINVYKNIQDNVEVLHEKLTYVFEQYDSISVFKGDRNPTIIDEALKSKESFYYWIREKYNNMDKNLIEHSALFIFLNKTCFRGMHRVGPNGFNVPFGHYKKTPKIISLDELVEIQNLIKKVEFKCLDFSESIKNIKKDDFAYFDPPYAQENAKSFVKYNKNGFPPEKHQELFNLILAKDQENVKMVISNSKTELVEENFVDFRINEIKARRAINSKNPGSVVKELIIYNFENS